MAKQPHDTPHLDQLEEGPWPSFVTGLKTLANDEAMSYDELAASHNSEIDDHESQVFESTPINM